jgi:RHS repeat-associated protein
VQAGTTTVQRARYLPYGQVRGPANQMPTDRGFLNQIEDDATGLTYLNNRYHDPAFGHFISVDPLVARTGEPYIYASANPTTLSDPTGLDPDSNAAIRERVKKSKLIMPSVNDAWEFARRLEMAFTDELGGDGTADEWWAPMVGGELACAGLWACQAARTHLLDHPNDLAGARVIASGYCAGARCADGFFWNTQGDFLLNALVLVSVLIGSELTTQVSRSNRPAAPSQAATNAVDDVLRPGGSLIGKAGTDETIRELTGGLTDAQSMFQRLSQGGTIVEQTATITRVQLADGGFVQLRTVMSRSPGTVATIDVNIPGLDITKLKFNP